MPVGRYFRGLSAFDLLGNLIPGAITLTVVIGFFSSPPLPNDLGGYALFAVASFVTGTVIQAHASKAVGKRESFDKTMAASEDLPSLSGASSADESPSTFKSISIGLLHAVFGPLFWWTRGGRGEKLDDEILSNRIWEHLIDTHEIPYNTDSFSVLYHVMSSKVDDISSPSRAVRIQAIRNFHRGMWLSSWYSLVLLMVAALMKRGFSEGEAICFQVCAGIPYTTPTYLNYWPHIEHLALVAGLGVVIFWFLFESTEEDYIEYLFADYAVAIADKGEESIKLSGESKLSISGEVDTKGPWDNSDDSES